VRATRGSATIAWAIGTSHGEDRRSSGGWSSGGGLGQIRIPTPGPTSAPVR
jgi:hypothetical protein